MVLSKLTSVSHTNSPLLLLGNFHGFTQRVALDGWHPMVDLYSALRRECNQKTVNPGLQAQWAAPAWYLQLTFLHPPLPTWHLPASGGSFCHLSEEMADPLKKESNPSLPRTSLHLRHFCGGNQTPLRQADGLEACGPEASGGHSPARRMEARQTGDSRPKESGPWTRKKRSEEKMRKKRRLDLPTRTSRAKRLKRPGKYRFKEIRFWRTPTSRACKSSAMAPEMI